ncbi:MAG: Asp-tRNA(Asn)/Glu-tRNA(Gln) amidotransferase subunit GatB [Alphaproteobacteria bacterium]
MNMNNDKNLIQGKTGLWEMVIGIEVHAQISSSSKLFSPAPTQFGAAPNHQVNFVDAAMPGMLPVLNKECVHQAIKTGLALNAAINTRSVFARKNYFYPDLPQGYQISQFDEPIVGNGQIDIDLEDGSVKTIRIERLHLEQDAGKSLHDQSPDLSFIDLNRSGVALMEIVSFPDIRSAEEAAAYVGKLRTILRYINACDGNMAEGSMRADVNLSLHRPGTPLGTRAEIKNVNSLRFIRQAIEVESKRQLALLEAGEEIPQETRLFDPAKGVTRSMRSKEDAHDYRYFPDPDLLPLILTQSDIDAARDELPELPDQKKQRFMREMGLNLYEAGIVTAERETAEYYEKALESKADPKQVCNWLIGELFGRLSKNNESLATTKITPDALGKLVALIDSGDISGKMAKDVFDKMFDTGDDPQTIVDASGLKQISDAGALTTMVDQLIADNQGQANAYRGGKTGLMGWFVGQIMKQTKGQANPAMVSQLLKERLDS